MTIIISFISIITFKNILYSTYIVLLTMEFNSIQPQQFHVT